MRTSPIDWLVGPEGRLRWYWWAWAPVLWILVGLALQATKWIDGSTQFGAFDRNPLIDPFYVVGPLVAYLYLCHVAQTAFEKFAPT